MLTYRPPAVASAATASGGVIYPVDPYVQQVLEYTAGLQRSTTGSVRLMMMMIFYFSLIV